MRFGVELAAGTAEDPIDLVSESESEGGASLTARFLEGQALVQKLEEGGDEDEAAVAVKALGIFEALAGKVAALGGLVSANEELEDVATADLKFVLVDFYLGWLQQKGVLRVCE